MGGHDAWEETGDVNWIKDTEDRIEDEGTASMNPDAYNVDWFFDVSRKF